MLQRLNISNVALVEQLEIDFEEGLNILTGETGAGKSIVIDAVNLVLGERASRELIKHGAQKARVEAAFINAEADGRLLALLEENGIESEEELILARELNAAGKSTCRINGTLVTLSTLKAVSDLLVDIHGQHAHQALLDPQRHVDFLDAYAQREIAPCKEETGRAAAALHELRLRSKGGAMSEEERARETDLLRYQVREIEAASLAEDEEETLLRERLRLSNAGRIMAALEEGHALFCDEQGVLQQLRQAQKSMEEVARFEDAYEALAARISDAYYNAEDIGFALRECKNGFEFDAERLVELEQRLDLIASLKRKYGRSVAAVLEYGERAKAKLQQMEEDAAGQADLQRRMEEAEARYKRAAGTLTEARRQAAERLKEEMQRQLLEVGMAGAVFETECSQAQMPVFGANGEDRVEFLLSANPGEPLKALAKVASGGELSRIMLAFKTILADRDATATLIFDEIDTGISGKMASIIAEKMVGIAEKHQILCVTHLPQIAAMADAHYLVEKHEEGGRTKTGITHLDEAACVMRLSAMMGGETSSNLGQEHARELLLAAQKQKELLRGKQT